MTKLDNKKGEFDKNIADKSIEGIKSLSELFCIPLVGTVIETVVGSLISLQNDRAIEYLNTLFEYLPPEKLKCYFSDDIDRQNLFEESLYIIPKTPNDMKRERLVNTLINGLSYEVFNYEEQDIIFKIIQKLSNTELVMLGFYKEKKISNNLPHLNKYKRKFPQLWIGSEVDQRDISLNERFDLENKRKSISYQLLSQGLIEVVKNKINTSSLNVNNGSSGTHAYGVDTRLEPLVNELNKDDSFKITNLGIKVLKSIEEPKK